MTKGIANDLKKRIEELERALRTKSESTDLIPVVEDQTDLIPRGISVNSLNDISETIEKFNYNGQNNIQEPSSISRENSAIPNLAPHPVKFDMSSGRLQFFGPTTNMHVFSGNRNGSYPTTPPECQWPISTLISDFSMTTHD